MQQIGNRTCLQQALVEHFPGVCQYLYIATRCMSLELGEVHLESDKILTDAVVQLPSNLSPFLVLHPHEVGGKLAQRRCPLSHLRFKFVMRLF